MAEVVLKSSDAQSTSNPFDVDLFATFSSPGASPVRVRGFYDGAFVWKIRFMPGLAGTWTYITDCDSDPALDKQAGSVVVLPSNTPGASPVRVRNTRRFEHADGSPHFSVGTTSYAWIHQNETLIANTVKTLGDEATPFNKMRMTIFPKWYEYNHVEPAFFAYEGTGPAVWDFTRFNVTFWQRLDERIMELQRANVQADLILFHPYDNGHWGFDCMGGRDAANYSTVNDERYLRYLVARVGAYRNVWYSMANEWDLVKCKARGLPDASPVWDRLFEVLAAEDVHGHLTSIHNCVQLYDHSRPWITHISSQGGYDMAHIKVKYAPKPIVWDEVMYEGDIPSGWGALTGGQMADRYWWALSYGIYCGHGETILHDGDAQDMSQVLWWSKGNVLRGDSPTRIKWFSKLAAPLFDSITCTCAGWGGALCDPSCTGKHTMGDGMNVATDERTFFVVHSSAYNNPSHAPQTSTLDLPEGDWELHPVDFWNMQVLAPTATLRGGGNVALTGAELTFANLTTNATLAPCGRSSATCCDKDAHACTPYMALLKRAS